MSIKQLVQTGEDSEGTFNVMDGLSFVRAVNNNAEELGTETKLDLENYNTPEAIATALKEQTDQIGYNTPGGPDDLPTFEEEGAPVYSPSEQKGGIAQIYNEALEEKEESLDTVYLGDKIKFSLKNSYDSEKVDAAITAWMRVDAGESTEEDEEITKNSIIIADAYNSEDENCSNIVIAGFNRDFGSYGYIDYWDTSSNTGISYLTSMESVKEEFKNYGFSDSEVAKLDYAWFYIDWDNLTFTKCEDVSSINVEFIVNGIYMYVEDKDDFNNISMSDSDILSEYFTMHSTDTVESLEIITPPDKTEYYKGDYVDISGMEVEATYSSGDTNTIDNQCLALTISPATTLTTDDTEFTVSYGNKSVAQDITVYNSLIR